MAIFLMLGSMMFHYIRYEQVCTGILAYLAVFDSRFTHQSRKEIEAHLKEQNRIAASYLAKARQAARLSTAEQQLADLQAKYSRR